MTLDRPRSYENNHIVTLTFCLVFISSHAQRNMGREWITLSLAVALDDDDDDDLIDADDDASQLLLIDIMQVFR